MNTVTVKINGMEYNLKGKENQEYLLDLAGYVDGKVREIMTNNGKLSSTAVAVLAGLNIADALFKSDEEAENLIKKKNSLEERHLTLRERIKELREEMDKSISVKDEEISRLKNIIENISTKVEEVDELDEKVKNLTSKLKEVDALKKELENANGQTAYYKEQLKLKDIECENHKENSKKLSNEVIEVKEVMNEEYENLKREIKLINSGNDDLRCAIEDSYCKISILEEENNKLIEEKESLSKEVRGKDKVITNKQNDIHNKNRQLEEKEKEIDIKNRIIEENKIEINNKIEIIKNKELEIENKNKEILEKENKIKECVSNEENKKYKEELISLGEQITIMEEELKSSIKMKEKIKDRSKEMHFQLQNSKFKVLDLEKKLIDAQIELAKSKNSKNNFPLANKI